MPRPRIYANDAEKMRAHRAKKRGYMYWINEDGFVIVDVKKSNTKVTNSNVTNQMIKNPSKTLDKVHKATHTELIISVLKTKVNRGISNERLYALAEFVVDQIYKDCRGY